MTNHRPEMMKFLLGQRRALLLLSSALTTGLAAPALAQTAPAPVATITAPTFQVKDPVQAPQPLAQPLIQPRSNSVAGSVNSAAARYLNLDENGVDVNDGSFNTSIVEGSIGSGVGALSMVRSYGKLGLTDNWPGQLSRMFVDGQRQVKLQFGNTTTVFKLVSGVFVPENADGSTLVEASNGASYIFTSSDGMRVNYAAPAITVNQSNGTQPAFASFCAASATAECILQPTSMIQPSGLTTNLTWNGVIACATSPSVYCVATARLQGIQNSAGYAATISYRSATPSASAVGLGETDWTRRTLVVFSNLKAPAQSWPQISYAYPSTNVTQITDMASRQWQITTAPGSAGVVQRIQRPGAATDTTVVTRNGTTGEVTSVLRDGVTTSYSRVANGSQIITTVTDALSNRTQIVSDANTSRAVQVTDELGRITRYGYDSAGRLETVTAPEGNITKTTYDARGNVTSTTSTPKPGSLLATITTRANYPTSCTNPVTCNKPTETIDARGAQTDYAYNSVTGYPTTVTAPAPVAGGARPQIRYSYEAFGGVTMLKETSTCRTLSPCAASADELKTTIDSYDSNLRPTSVTVAAGNAVASAKAKTTYTYDAIGNQITVDGPLSATTDVSRIVYDAGRRVVGVIGPDPDGAAVALKNRAKRITYGADGQATLVEIGTVTGQTDAAWAGFAPLRKVATSYDANGRKISDRLSAGTTTFSTYSVTHYSYDLLGRLDCAAQRMNPAVWDSLPPSACTLQAAGSFGADRITRQSYNEAGELVKTTSAYGTAAQADDARYTYTLNGQIETVTDANGNLTRQNYDGFDRVEKTFFPSQTVPGSINPSDYTKLTYDPNGNVISLRTRKGDVINYQYDALDRLMFKDVGISSANVAYGYDLLGAPLFARFGSATGQGITNIVDALGRVEKTTTNLDGVVRDVSYQYDVAGRRTKITYPDQVLFTYTYDFIGAVKTIAQTTAPAANIATFVYDLLGARKTLTRGSSLGVTSYTYDPVGRLTQQVNNITATGVANDITYDLTYNPAGQIISRNVTTTTPANYVGPLTPASLSFATNGLNQYKTVGATTFSYDDNGNLTSQNDGTLRTYTYDVENRLTGGSGNTPVSLRYDPVGRLYETSSSSRGVARFIYDGDTPIAEYNNAGVMTHRYVMGPGVDEPLLDVAGPTLAVPVRQGLFADERGSVVALATASTVTRNLYDDYGAPPATYNNSGRYQYTGQMSIPELGLYHYKARTYAPYLGRFMQTDPIGYGDGMNLYAYVGSDPVNLVDASGLTAIERNLNVKVDGVTAPADIVVTGTRPTAWDRQTDFLKDLGIAEILNARGFASGDNVGGGGALGGGVNPAPPPPPKPKKPPKARVIANKICRAAVGSGGDPAQTASELAGQLASAVVGQFVGDRLGSAAEAGGSQIGRYLAPLGEIGAGARYAAAGARVGKALPYVGLVAGGILGYVYRKELASIIDRVQDVVCGAQEK